MQNISQISSVKTNLNRTLKEASQESAVMLVFLRHFGCVFCREAMLDIGKRKEEWKAKNINVILVHMSDEETANVHFEKYGVAGFENVSDPSCSLYSMFGLGKGRVSQLFGLKNFIRGFETTVKGIPIGLRQIGDGFQMPGVFLLRNGNIMDSYIHSSAADRPDYESLISCCVA